MLTTAAKSDSHSNIYIYTSHNIYISICVSPGRSDQSKHFLWEQSIIDDHTGEMEMTLTVESPLAESLISINFPQVFLCHVDCVRVHTWTQIQ